MGMRRAFFSFLLMFLVSVTLLFSAFHVQPVRGQGTIYIRADGSIDPPTAPISRSGAVYTLTSNIYDSIVIQKNNVTVDGAGYKVQGSDLPDSKGISIIGEQWVTVSNVQIKNFTFGIYIYNSVNNTISGNNLTATYSPGDAVYLQYSTGNIISGNYITASGLGFGIGVADSSNNSLLGNNVSANYGGAICLSGSSNNVVSGNKIADNKADGISLFNSAYNLVTANILTSNRYGINLMFSSTCNIVSGNVLVNNGLYWDGSYGNTVDNNTVNGKPLVYLEASSSSTVDFAGQVILIDCQEMTVKDLSLTLVTPGILLSRTNRTNIFNNNITATPDGILLRQCSSDFLWQNNFTNCNYGIGLVGCLNITIWRNDIQVRNDGIFLDSSTCISIFENNVTSTTMASIFPYSSTSNRIYHNNICDNPYWISGYNSTNIWDDGYPSGGNYWSDYVDTDLYSGPYQNEAGSDGIWDHPYVIDANNTDHYPLVNPWTTTPQLWGVIVGVGDYISQEDLVLPANDARDIYSRLISSGWKADHMKLLIDSEATKANVEAAIEWMRTNAGSSDLCLFFFSGYGTYSIDDLPPDAESDGHDEYICPVDSLQGSHDSNIRDDELAAWLEGIAGPKVVILESCHSGGFISDLQDSGQIVILAACEEDALSKQEEELQHGVFAFYILEGLAGPADTDQNNQISAEEIFSYSSPRVTEHLAQQDEEQLPQFYDAVPGEVVIARVPTVADSFRFPFDGLWTVRQRFGGYNYDWNGFHLGEDVLRSYEAPVYAPANGVVKHSAKCTGYGYVVIIEHELLDGTFVCSVLGHLREAGRIPVGTRVTKGQIVGYLSSVPEENGGIIHLHFGIRKGMYSEELDFDGKWRYRGYGPIDIVGSWFSPSAFIEYYNENNEMPPSYSLTINTEESGAFAATGSTSVCLLTFKTQLSLIATHPWFQRWINADNEWINPTTVTMYSDRVVIEWCLSAPPPLPPKPWELAIDLIGADYSWGGQGWSWNPVGGWAWSGGKWLSAEEIKAGYYHYQDPDGRGPLPGAVIHAYGVDCSGMVTWAYNKAYGSSVVPETLTNPLNPIYHSADAVYLRYYGTSQISKEELQPGDLLFFDTDLPKTVDHVAMYVGEFIHTDGHTYNVVHATITRDGVVQKVTPALFNPTDETLTTPEPDPYVDDVLTVNRGYGRVNVGLDNHGQLICKSPVDLIITDPDGIILSKEVGEVAGMSYMEFDVDGDGDLDDIVDLWERKIGNYLITVVPHPDALPTDNFTIEFSANGTTMLLADHAQISEVPTDPYIITQNETAIMLRNINVAFTNMTISKSVVGQGRSFAVNATVQNQGNLEETFNVTLYANTTIIASQAVTLASGNSSIITFAWNTSSQVYGNYNISAYAWPVLDETYTTDNNFTGGTVKVTIAGDINGDFIVDIYDAILLAGAYNSVPTSPNWNPNADINGDIIVDIYDAIILANHYNQHYP
jgi:parallel beta-helix repeat protein